MKLDHVRSDELREWIVDYTDSKLAERKSRKTTTDDLLRVWASFREPDWQAWRTLQDLRPRALARFSKEECEAAIARKVAAAPPPTVNNVTYQAPYSLGLEVAALREFLGEAGGVIRETVEFHS